jgi:hypothetical protein
MMAQKGSRGSSKKYQHDPRCSWEASGGRCRAGATTYRVGAVRGLCPWHEHVSGAGGPRGTYEEFSAYRREELERDRRWALYSSRDWWRLLNGEYVGPPSCACGRAICSNLDVLVPEGIAPPPQDAPNGAGEVVCVRCGPAHPANVEASMRRLKEKQEMLNGQSVHREGQRLPRARGRRAALCSSTDALPLAAGPARGRIEAPVEDPSDGVAGE